MLAAFNTIIPSIRSIQSRPGVAVPNHRYSNLAPLPYDTVSFGASEKNIENKKYGVNFATAKQVNVIAKDSEKYLKKQLSDIFSDIVRDPDDPTTFDRPIEAVSFRTKSAESIKEKSASRKFFNVQEIKSHMTDLVGARLIFADASKQNIDKAVLRLADAEANNKLKILEIENYRPDPILDEDGKVEKSYDYASPKALTKLKNECDKHGSIIPKRDEDLPTGYMALHFLVQLPNGLTGEIQMLGTDVAELKEIEDLCYKTKAGKSVDKKYAPVAKMLQPLADKSDTILQNEYMRYTRDAYIVQRDKEPQIGKHKLQTKFLEIPDYLPKELDFNVIDNKMRECDALSKKDNK